MIIRTSQDAASVDCCPCDPSACDAPRKECESITLELDCGYSMPYDYPDLTAEELCKRFGTVTYVHLYRVVQVVPLDAGYSNDYDSSETTTVVRGINTAGATCTQRIDSTAWLKDTSSTTVSGGATTIHTDYHEESGSTFDSPCGGNYTYTDHLDAGNNSSGDYDICPIIINEADSTYSKTGFSFLLDSSFEVDEYTDVTVIATVTYSNPIDAAFVSARFEELLFPDDVNGNSCNSEIVTSSTCPDTIESATKARYRMGIPSAWADFTGRHAAWVISHAAWVAADPETRGDEPVEPIERSYFQAQWDEVFFPTDWEAWKELKDAHDVWVACGAEDPPREGGCGDEPEAPGAEPTAPSLVASRSWTYPGGGGSAEYSAWFEIPLPETEGETRVVNLLTKCHRNTRLGVKPTSHEEVYELA